MKKILALVALYNLILMFGSCGSSSPEEEKETQTFVLSDTMMNRITLDTVKNEIVKSQLVLTGKVLPDENKVIEVFPLVGGNVIDVFVELGDYVKKGQLLAVIRSGEIADYERQLIDAQSNLLVAQKQLIVTEELFEGKLSSEKELLTAKKDVEKAQAELNRIKEVYKIYSIQDGSEYVIKSPITGFIVHKNINRDMQLRSDKTDHVFTISQLDQLWVIANVFESDISKMKLGYDARIQTISYPDKIFNGKIDKLYNILDPVTKTMKVRITIDNSDFLLKPEMHATILVSYNRDYSLNRVPSKAIIFDQSKNFVMVFKDKYNVETREIQVEKSVGDITYVTRGLNEGEIVISQNQLLIYDALND